MQTGMIRRGHAQDMRTAECMEGTSRAVRHRAATMHTHTCASLARAQQQPRRPKINMLGDTATYFRKGPFVPIGKQGRTLCLGKVTIQISHSAI